MLKLRAPAKINLFLRILAQEKSGFHQLETAFAALEFGDTVALSPGGEGISLSTEGPPVGPLKENLAFRAAEAFMQEMGGGEGVRIALKKNIPPGAGLGGGSSDAAATLLGLDELFPGKVDRSTLLAIAGRLGSDVPFFLSGSSFALAWGRGDRLLPMPPLPRAPVLLCLPSLEVSTPWAYKALAEARSLGPFRRGPCVMDTDLMGSWEGMSTLVENDFQEMVFQEHPALRSIHGELERTGPRFSLLSGSGAALFALYRDEASALRALEALSVRFHQTRFVLTSTAFSEVGASGIPPMGPADSGRG